MWWLRCQLVASVIVRVLWESFTELYRHKLQVVVARVALFSSRRSHLWLRKAAREGRSRIVPFGSSYSSLMVALAVPFRSSPYRPLTPRRPEDKGVGGKVVVRANILGTVIGPSGQDLSRMPRLVRV